MRHGIALFPSRRRALFLGAVGLAGGISYLHGATVERHWTEVTETTLPTNLGENGPQRLRVAVLTDFHYDPLHEAEFFARIVAETNATGPDLVLLLGDFISEVAAPAADLTPILAQLHAPLGIKAVLGNHDCWHGPVQIAKHLERQGIEVLRNRLVRFPTADGELCLAGLDSVWGGNPDPRVLRALRPGERLLMAHHEPDFIDELPPALRDKIALQVSGHTHGGQICAPGGVVLQRPSYGERYSRGLYRLSPQTQLYVSRGLGTVGIHARLFCRPEIALLTLINTARSSIPA